MKRVFDEFCTENPEYADENSPERKLGDKLYRQRYQDAVTGGEMDYRAALERVKTLVEEQTALQEVKSLRSNRQVTDRAPTFFRGGEIEERRGGISAGSPKNMR